MYSNGETHFEHLMLFAMPEGFTLMRKIAAALLFLLALSITSEVYGRAGQAADDCPPTSKDPDCAGAK